MLRRDVHKLNAKLARAESYSEWKEIATEIEGATGIDRWKLSEHSTHYDHREIRFRLDKLRSLRARRDYQGLLFTLNEGIHGNIGGIGRSRLYRRPLYGTKRLIIEYVDEVADALDVLAENEIKGIDTAQRIEFFKRVSHCFGRSAFMMSGGGMLLYFHIGVVRCLIKNDLLPDIISGSSGGAYVAAILGTHSKAELLEMLNARDIAEKIEKLGQPGKSSPGTRSNALSAEELSELLNVLVPDLTFSEAYELSGRYINIPVAPAESHQTAHLLNATTTPNVCIHEAVRASGAMPGLYKPVSLAAKDDSGDRKIYMPSRKWFDGSISDDIPAKKLARLYGVNHFIVSQINPHLVPFINDAQREHDPGSIIRNASIKSTRAWLNATAALFHDRIAKNQALNIRINRLLSIINQDYVGDINILPPFKFPPPINVLAHPSETDMEKVIEMGERATWPKLDMISIQTKISRTLQSICMNLDNKPEA